MLCRLAARFGGMPSDWAAMPEIYIHTMIALAKEQDEAQKNEASRG